jgi:endonuclease/exonuclease/phosphatase family metal-dependent hydrolase
VIRQLLPALALLPACLDEAPVDDSSLSDELHGRNRISVMTQNQYLGADLTGIIAAPDAATFAAEVREALDQIAANRIAERAYALALQIARRQPDVVGLQEVFDFKLDGANGDAPFRDHLADTLAALAALGQHYTVVAQVQNLAITIPIDADGDGVPDAGVGVRDRDVILVRSELAATPVPFSAGCARPSADGGPGCNFQVVAQAPTPVGTLTIERGFVGVDVTVRGRDYRVVDTHLEVPDLDPTNPLSPGLQAAQAQELLATVAATTPAGRTLIALGDFNSAPDDQIIVVGGVTIVPPYLQLQAAGLTDTWVVDRHAGHEATCCQAEDLRNPQSQLVERIDLIFSSEAPSQVQAEVLGDRRGERTPSGLWPSDHGTVSARLRF